ncbi:MAG: hypothetical protein KF752_18585 [Pirellulaceae bacterium]|nr:hypothetical protein [Pirellulaceae bacterium]
MPKTSHVGDQEVQMDRRRNRDSRAEPAAKVSSKPKSASSSANAQDRRSAVVASDDSASVDAPACNQAETSDSVKEAPVRRKQQRRRQIDPTTCEREYNGCEIEFMHAIDAYKRASGRMFPTCSEILEVIQKLGYVKLTADERLLLHSISEVEGELAQATELELIKAGEDNR